MYVTYLVDLYCMVNVGNNYTTHGTLWVFSSSLVNLQKPPWYSSGNLEGCLMERLALFIHQPLIAKELLKKKQKKTSARNHKGGYSKSIEGPGVVFFWSALKMLQKSSPVDT